MTSTGVTAEVGRTVAVDPNVISYGSIIEIRYADGSSHQYVAEDCGGGVKGNHIDIFVSDHSVAKQAGRIDGAEVYLIAKGGN